MKISIMLNALRRHTKEHLQNSMAGLFDRAGFGAVLDAISLVSLDIGARGGAQNDLLPLAKAVDLYGFEPDRTEFERLKNNAGSTPWKNFTVLPHALGKAAEMQTLHLYKKAGCHSLLQADPAKAALFSRADYYEPQGSVNVAVESLDTLIQRNELPAPDHIKIDVQGWELDVFKGAGKALRDNVLAVRTEVCFFDLYKGQPFFADIDACLRGLGFVFMGFVESHGWRRRTKIKWPRHMGGPIPYSRGQLIHADALYLKAPEDLTEGQDLLKLGLLAAAYEYLDHAAACFARAEAKTLGKACQTDIESCLANLSTLLGRRRRYLGFLNTP